MGGAGDKRKRDAADAASPAGGLAAKKAEKMAKKQARAARLMDRRFGEKALKKAFRGGAGGNVRRADFRRNSQYDAQQQQPPQEGDQPPRQAQTRHGPHFTSAGAASTKINDEWQTARSSWAVLEPLFSKFKARRVWQPFYYDGVCAMHLTSLGFRDVVHEPGVDFFARCAETNFVKKVDFIWDNPPYTNADTKEAVLKALADTGKPFCMLLPSSVLHTKFVRDVLDMSQVQVLFPRRVMVCKTGRSPVPFKFLIWLCYRCGLERDVYFVDDPEEEERGDGDAGGAAAAREVQAADPRGGGAGRGAAAAAAEADEEDEEEEESDSGDEDGGDEEEGAQSSGEEVDEGEEEEVGGSDDDEEDEDEDSEDSEEEEETPQPTQRGKGKAGGGGRGGSAGAAAARGGGRGRR